MIDWSEFALCYRKGLSFKDAFYVCGIPMTHLETARHRWSELQDAAHPTKRPGYWLSYACGVGA